MLIQNEALAFEDRELIDVPGAAMMSFNGGNVTQIGMMKKRPAIPPTGTQRLIAVGTLVAGWSTSSAIAEIMPIAENV